jgi:hypothetical protein
MGSGSSSGSGQLAQQPSGSFKASDYKTKSECMAAAQKHSASTTACNSLP